MARDLHNEISLVRGHLAIGSRACAEQAEVLQSFEIGAILSLTPIEPPLPVPHLVVDIQDRRPLPRDAVEACIAFIDQQKEEGHRVLVHCEMGISRSPAICACYLCEREGLSVEEAHYQIKVQHPVADPHPVLRASIKGHYYGTNRRLFARLRSHLWGDPS